ncbi:hypothetical protein [Methylobacterium sp. NFXW15]|uniref:hypothetical protein n=1 Tax=Methylobacterium sp. NFXW15 TaxID=2819512 RepID=UPI003CEACAD6
MVVDQLMILLVAAIKVAGITFTADWLAGHARRDGKLAEVLPGWGGREDSGICVIIPSGRLVPTEIRLFVDEVAEEIKTGWGR